MYTMAVPKFLWNEKVIDCYLFINHMPSKVLGMKNPYGIFGKNELVVQPKVLGVLALLDNKKLQCES
jgi:hypothetical protein